MKIFSPISNTLSYLFSCAAFMAWFVWFAVLLSFLSLSITAGLILGAQMLWTGTFQPQLTVLIVVAIVGLSTILRGSALLLRSLV